MQRSTPPHKTATDNRIIDIPIDLITAGPYQARRHFTGTLLDELAASIAESGVIQPVVVRGDRHAGYTLLAGERRWRAAARAGLHKLPALVRNDLDDDEAAILGLIENLQRESLGVIDTARGLQSLCHRHALTHDAVAARIGKSRAYVTNYLRILKLAQPVQKFLDDGELSLGHAKALAGMATEQQSQLARRAIRDHLSVRAMERMARSGTQSATAKDGSTADDDADLQTLEQRLSAHLGNTVRIHYSPGQRRGRIHIDFHDLDEFDGLLSRFGFSADGD